MVEPGRTLNSAAALLSPQLLVEEAAAQACEFLQVRVRNEPSRLSNRLLRLRMCRTELKRIEF